MKWFETLVLIGVIERDGAKYVESQIFTLLRCFGRCFIFSLDFFNFGDSLKF
jgi:hypothetical protein